MSTNAHSQPKILLTGGAGYIGTHIAHVLLLAGFRVVVLDNFSNANPVAVQRTVRLSNRAIEVVEGDIRDAACLDALFAQHDIAGVVHLAGLKAVGESTQKPGAYYDCNVYGSLVLLQAMERAQCRTILFSSTATVYGNPETVPVREDARLWTTNPYAATKLAVEEMIVGFRQSDPRWRALSLRYFNPVGAHESGQIGEDPTGIPNNLFPYIAQVAVGRRTHLNVFGDDYDTHDGTGVRDYLHVMDLADAHHRGLTFLLAQADGTTVPRAINIGTGIGYSVLDCLSGWSQAVGRALPYQIAPRRPGDVAAYFAAPDMARDILGWQATRALNIMCADHWRWQNDNPNGYEQASQSQSP